MSRRESGAAWAYACRALRITLPVALRGRDVAARNAMIHSGEFAAKIATRSPSEADAGSSSLRERSRRANTVL